MKSLTVETSGPKISGDVNVEIIQKGSRLESKTESQSECKDALL